MKKILIAVFSVAFVFFLSFGINAGASEIYTITVNGKAVYTDKLPCTAYKNGETIMVPLRAIGEKMGYTIGWDSETEFITIDDGYIQKAILTDGSASAIFEGRLKIIDLSRTVYNEAPTSVINGCTYVPLKFFEEFFYRTTVKDHSVEIMPVTYELN